MKTMLLSAALAFCLASIPCEAFAKCGRWPVKCTGIHPGTGVSGYRAALGAAWALREAVGGAIANRGMSEAEAWNDVGNKRFLKAVRYFTANNCRAAISVLRKGSVPAYQRALAIEPSNQQFAANLNTATMSLTECEGWKAINLIEQADKIRQSDCVRALSLYEKSIPYTLRALEVAANHEENAKRLTDTTKKITEIKNGQACDAPVSAAVKVLEVVTSRLRYKPNDRRGWSRGSCHIDLVTNELLHWDGKKWAPVSKEWASMTCPVWGGIRG